MKIIRNSGACTQCGDEIESTNRHDFCYCKCKAIAVDGGQDYLKRMGEPNDFRDTSVYQVDLNKLGKEDDYLSKYIIWSPSGKTNPGTVFTDYPSALKVAEAMGKEHKAMFFVCQVS